MISLRPPKRVLEQRGTSLRTAVDARIDGGDVNLVTTSASGELQNHPEAQIKLPWVRRLQNFIPLTPQRTFRKLNPTHGGSAQTFLIFPWPFRARIFFPCQTILTTESRSHREFRRIKLLLFVPFRVFRGHVFL